MLLGVDVGTTGTKAILTWEDGRVVHSSYQGYELISPKMSHVEQSPEDWWRAIISSVRECVAHVPSSERITAMCLSVQSGTLVLVDKNYQPTMNAISWLDTRGAKAHKSLLTLKGEHYFYERTGWRLSNCYNFIQICHLRQHEPDIFDKTAYFLSVSDYLNHRLTGELVIDENSAENSQLLNIGTREWDDEILNLAGIDKDRISRTIMSGILIGTLTQEAADELNLDTKTQVISGAQDQYCSAISAGAICPGDIMFSTGTSWVLLGVSGQQIYDKNTFLTIRRHIIPGLFSSFAYTPAGGAALKWYRDNMGASKEGNQENYDDITARAEHITPGSQGLLFFPHLGGTLFPTWSEKSRGLLWGLDFSHTKDHIARAVMEGIAFDLLWMVRSMQTTGYDFQVMKCLGGSTRSQVWMQMVSDMTGLVMVVSDYANMAPLGAVMLASVGSGLYKNYEEVYSAFNYPVRKFYPNYSRYQQYQEIFSRYREVFELQQNLFAKYYDEKDNDLVKIPSI